MGWDPRSTCSPSRLSSTPAFPIPFVGHELAHAWWGNLVTTKPGPGRMVLTEGLATFGMVLTLEAVEGSEAGRRFRLGRYPGYSFNGGAFEYFRMAAAGLELPLALQPPRGARDTMIMHRMANTKGYFALEALSMALGRDRFLKSCVARPAPTPAAKSDGKTSSGWYCSKALVPLLKGGAGNAIGLPRQKP